MSTETHSIRDDTIAHYGSLIIEVDKMRQASADALRVADTWSVTVWPTTNN